MLKKQGEYPLLGSWRLSLFEYEGVSLCDTTIWRILTEARSPKLPPQILYILTHPFQIWFVDHMHLRTLKNGQKVYSLIVLDGWSRVLVSDEIVLSKGARDAIEVSRQLELFDISEFKLRYVSRRPENQKRKRIEIDAVQLTFL